MYAALMRVHGGVAVEGFRADFAQIRLARHGAWMFAHQMLFESSFGQHNVAKVTLLKKTIKYDWIRLETNRTLSMIGPIIFS